MKWEPQQCADGSGEWIEANTPVGVFVVDDSVRTDRVAAIWYPAFLPAAEVLIGEYVSEAGAKRAIKRYAKRMAAAFKACAKAGWE